LIETQETKTGEKQITAEEKIVSLKLSKKNQTADNVLLGWT
jgi:hypothetical protein